MTGGYLIVTSSVYLAVASVPMVMVYSPVSGSSPCQSLTPSAPSSSVAGGKIVKEVFGPAARWTLIVWPAFARSLYSWLVQRRTVSLRTAVVLPRAKRMVFGMRVSARLHCAATFGADEGDAAST